MSPLALARMTRAEAAETRRRHAPRAAIGLSGGGRLRLVEAAPSSERRGGVRVRLHVGDDRMDVFVPQKMIETCVHTLDKALQPDGLPDDLAALILEAAFRDDLDRLEVVCDRRISVESVTRADADAASGGVHLTTELHGDSWPVWLAASDGNALLETLASRWPIAPRPMSRFPIPAALRLGATQLRYDELVSLRPGDVVLMQFTDAKGARLVVCERLLAAARKDGERWVLAEPPRTAGLPEKREWTMDQDSDATAPDQPITDTDALPTQLTFDIGQVPMTMGALRHLGAGAVVELNRDVQELVRISANGALVGHGELVDVEGRAGVRIVRLFDHG